MMPTFRAFFWQAKAMVSFSTIASRVVTTVSAPTRTAATPYDTAEQCLLLNEGNMVPKSGSFLNSQRCFITKNAVHEPSG
jgi:hypothetical protein